MANSRTRRWVTAGAALAVVAFGLAGPAAAQGDGALAAAQSAFLAGRFDAAARLGERSGAPEGLALAARSWLAHCALNADDAEVEALADRAIAAAEAALARDPDQVEARLQWAIALGVKGRRMSTGAALRSGYAQRGRALIGEALALDPQNAWAHAALGGWHLEVWRRGGWAGGAALGADIRTGQAAFARARALDPADPVLALQYGLALLALDPARFRGEAAAQLAAAASLPPRNGFEHRMQAEAARLRDTLRRDGPGAAAAAAAAFF